MSSYSMEIVAEQFSNFELVFRIRFTTESAKPQSSIVVFLNFRGDAKRRNCEIFWINSSRNIW